MPTSPTSTATARVTCAIPTWTATGTPTPRSGRTGPTSATPTTIRARVGKSGPTSTEETASGHDACPNDSPVRRDARPVRPGVELLDVPRHVKPGSEGGEMSRRRWAGAVVLVALAIAGGSVAGFARGSTSWTAKVDAGVLDAAAAGRTEMLVYLERRAD